MINYRIVVKFGVQYISWLHVQTFAFGKLNICSNLWCNHWLSCHGRWNCYVLTMFKVDNCTPCMTITLVEKFACPLADRRPIQWHASVVGSSSTPLLQIMPAISCRIVLRLDLPQVKLCWHRLEVPSLLGKIWWGQPIANNIAENVARSYIWQSWMTLRSVISSAKFSPIRYRYVPLISVSKVWYVLHVQKLLILI